eukprot:TRINITY_DN29504_c0_g1_i1.p1 TRINITY_DN29504_c0_g1~~TRINITY_DN29504_c0_g1_i1.p1  ORF type:complete len:372 (+),score=50.51 TRINITY_DN29504_c0_g1_i1:92-1207(+)
MASASKPPATSKEQTLSGQMWAQLGCRTACCCDKNKNELEDPVSEKISGDDNLPRAYRVGEKLGGEFTASTTEGSVNDLLEERPAVEVELGFYIGQWLSDVVHGQGALLRFDGTTYKGSFANGLAHGQGRFTASDGSVYEGEWQCDSAHGQGAFTYQDGSCYDGQWVNDEKCGKGLLRWSHGLTYMGDFSGGCKHGHGVFTDSGRVIYKGQFVKDRMHGCGTYTWKDGREYTGQYVDGMMQGSGIMRLSGGFPCYEGQFVKNKFEGEGTMTLSDSHGYRGRWLGGKRHGVGTTFGPDGFEVRSEWVHGTEVKSGNAPVVKAEARPSSTTPFQSEQADDHASFAMADPARRRGMARSISSSLKLPGSAVEGS